MVLPEPAAHDAPDQAVGWLDEVALALRLSKAATLTLIDKAHPARLGDLVRTLRHEWPDIDVIADVGKVVDVPVGSTIVLAPRKEDAEWLNLHRGQFADRKLKVVLWCDEETALALKFRAPDFSDWIGRRKECPRGLVPFAIRGVRAAFENGWPVAWTGTAERAAVEAVVRAAFPGEEVVWLSEDAPFDELVSGMKAPEVVAVDARKDRALRRARWARASAGRKARVVLVTGELGVPGFWPAHDRTMPLSEACERLAAAGAKAPGRVAALLDLEPEAVALAERVLLGDPFHRGLGVTGPDTEGVLAQALEESDTGAALARWALGPTGKAPWAKEPSLDGCSPPVLRGLADRARPYTSGPMDAVERRIEDVERALRDRGEVVAERRRRLREEPVLDIAWAAASLGDGEVAAALLAEAREEEVRAVFRPVLSSLSTVHDANALLAVLREAVDGWNRAIEARQPGVQAWVDRLSSWEVIPMVLFTPLTLFLLIHLSGESPARLPWVAGAWIGMMILWFATAHHKKRLEEVLIKRMAAPNLEPPARSEQHGRREESGVTHLLTQRGGAGTVRLTGRPAISGDLCPSKDLLSQATRLLTETGRAAEATRALVHLTATCLPAAGNLRPESGRSAGDDPFLQRLLEQPAGMLSALPEAHLTLVDALLKQGRYPEALMVARGAVERFSPGRKEKAVSELAARTADLERRVGTAAE